MAVCLISRDYSTNYCVFSYDSWATDGNLLPNLSSSGKQSLSNIKSCCQGSRAECTDGKTVHVLTGENIWLGHNTNSGGGGGGGSDDPGDSGGGFIEL